LRPAHQNRPPAPAYHAIWQLNKLDFNFKRLFRAGG
jgi:hypothetical protein